MDDRTSRRVFLQGAVVSGALLGLDVLAGCDTSKPSAASKTIVLTSGQQRMDVTMVLSGGLSTADIELDFVVQGSQWEQEVWGFAIGYNKADHVGTVQASGSGNQVHLDVTMKINADPWVAGGDAHYSVDVTPSGSALKGSYTGTFNGQQVSGQANGKLQAPWPAPIAGVEPVAVGEHPRLVVRKAALPDLRTRAQTTDGQAIVARLKQLLTSMQGKLDSFTAGSYTAGQALLYTLTADQSYAASARQVVEQIINGTIDSLNYWNDSHAKMILRVYGVVGVALTYDLCYDEWDSTFRSQMTTALASKAAEFIKGGGSGYNNNPWSNWNAETHGGAGMAALAVLGEAGVDASVAQNAKIAERAIKRYLQNLGDHAWDQEGDDYLRYSMDQGLLPFLQAHRNVTATDLVSGSSAEWLLPFFIMKLVQGNGQLSYPVYGTARDGSWYRDIDRSGEFAMGLGSASTQYRLVVLWAFENYFGAGGANSDKTFDVTKPHHAVYALANYPTVLGRADTTDTARNPADVLPRVIEDGRLGGYIFRNRWQDGQDCVATVFLKTTTHKGGWSFSDTGSFRIWGMGGQWVSKGSGNSGDRANENIVLIAGTRGEAGAQKLSFLSSSDGSGIVSMNMNDVYRGSSNEDLGITSVRSFAVDYSGAAGVPGLFVLVDTFTGTTSTKTWLLHTSGQVTISGQTFTVQDSHAPGSTLVGTFVAPTDVQLSFTNGVLSGSSASDTFFVVMTVQTETAPTSSVSGSGASSRVSIGKQSIWFADNRIQFAQMQKA